MEIVAIGFDVAENVETLNAWRDSNDMPFAFVVGPRGLIQQYNVLSRSTKFGIGRDGVISYRGEYGTSSADDWRQRLRALTGG